MRILALLLALLVAGCAEARKPDIRDYALRLEFHDAEAVTICGGTKGGPNGVRTAQHCLQRETLTVDGTPVRVLSVVERSPDSVDLTIAGLTFKAWARPGTVKVGDRVRWNGNPKGIRNVYREGPVVAVVGGLVVVQATVCHGDSGSGMLNDRGEIVGVISRMAPELSPCTFAVGES